ncbi:MAG: hypothetical protein CR217_09530 [Beijerinckiaceae bacterium]|nr:MAG: hypothetical protein CR217_09530 [Beijerinckiaceae bacterium]
MQRKEVPFRTYPLGVSAEKPKSWRAAGTRVIGRRLTRSSLVTLAQIDFATCERAVPTAKIVTAPTVAAKKAAWMDRGMMAPFVKGRAAHSANLPAHVLVRSERKSYQNVSREAFW